MSKSIDIEKTKEAYLQFVDQRKNLILSLKDHDGNPFVSYAPFIQHDQKFYIYISRIADHFSFMQKNEVVDAFLIADEAETVNKFATERVRWPCVPKQLADDDGNEHIFEEFVKLHNPQLINLLRGLDFSLFELTPNIGRYVVSFGLAFNVSVDGTVFEHVVIDKKKED